MMKEIKFDFNNFFSFNIGLKDGVSLPELKKLLPRLRSAHLHLNALFSSPQNRKKLSLEWVMLPFQAGKALDKIKKIGTKIARNYENVIFLGIGGSYLGLKAAQDALMPPYYNEFASERRKNPKVYFEGNNLDPESLKVLLKNLNPRKTFIVVISKSGETTETKAAFEIAENWLKGKIGRNYGRQIAVITDPESGALRQKALDHQSKDALSFISFPLLKGVGGRFSEFNMGLLHLAILGVNIDEVLQGARQMLKRCTNDNILKNPAYLYASLNYLLYVKKNKIIAVLMPFSQSLKSTADWYVQLLAESLGKKYGRKIIKRASQEEWIVDKQRILNTGRTPIAACGTQDLHSIQQNNIEGENNKTVTFIKVLDFKNELKIPSSGGILSKKSLSSLMALAQEATEWALVREMRPNCTIILPEISPYYWGGLLFFFEMATAFEGELLGVNAFDQPGVEGYKNYMYFKLGKRGMPLEVIKEIKKNPLKKSPDFIL